MWMTQNIYSYVFYISKNYREVYDTNEYVLKISFKNLISLNPKFISKIDRSLIWGVT